MESRNQSIAGKTYLGIHRYSVELCCRPASVLEESEGIVCTPYFTPPFLWRPPRLQWEIVSFGAGYTVRMVHSDRTSGG